MKSTLPENTFEDYTASYWSRDKSAACHQHLNSFPLSEFYRILISVRVCKV